MSGTMNTVANSTQTDQLSPTTLILKYLQDNKQQPTPDNIRRAVMANARESNMPGADPVAGLRNARPSSEAEDQAAMAAAGQGAGSPRTSAAPASSTPPTNTLTADADKFAATQGGGAGASSGGGLDLSSLILGALPLLGIPGMSRNLGPKPGSNTVGEPNYQLGMPERAPGVQIEAPRPQIGATPQLGGPTPSENPLDLAMQRALAPPGSAELSGVRPYTPNPMDIVGQGQALPPGVTDVDATRAAVGDLNRNPAAEKLNPEQTVPFKSQQPRVPPNTPVRPRVPRLMLR